MQASGEQSVGKAIKVLATMRGYVGEKHADARCKISFVNVGTKMGRTGDFTALRFDIERVEPLPRENRDTQDFRVSKNTTVGSLAGGE